MYPQGDKEKEKGLTPDPMMDRSKAMNLPSDQVNFVKYLCMPAYEIIGKVFPNTEEMLNNVKWEIIRTFMLSDMQWFFLI